MTNETTPTSFPATRQDLNNLKQNATDAARDLAGTAQVHAEKVGNNLRDLASHAQGEGWEQLDQVKVRCADLGNVLRSYVTERPLTSIGTALALGFLFGLSRRVMLKK
jgi:ElaB/YqjD/DUF883 family membrane-anchored ribosome-binding protein